MWNQTLGHPDLKMFEIQLLLTVFFIGLPLNERPLGVSPFPSFFWSLIKYSSYPKSWCVGCFFFNGVISSRELLGKLGGW